MHGIIRKDQNILVAILSWQNSLVLTRQSLLSHLVICMWVSLFSLSLTLITTVLKDEGMGGGVIASHWQLSVFTKLRDSAALGGNIFFGLFICPPALSGVSPAKYSFSSLSFCSCNFLPLSFPQQCGCGRHTVHEALLQRLLHWCPKATGKDSGLHLWPLPCDQWQAWEEHRRTVERNGWRGQALVLFHSLLSYISGHCHGLASGQ